MKTIELKTNIMCGSCVAKVKPVLNEAFGEENWKVDITNTKKILTVSAVNANKGEVINVLIKAGFKEE